MSTLGTLILEGADLLGVNLLSSSTTYAIVSNDTAQVVVTPDTILSLEYRGEERISTYPVEQGAFSSYNKVAVPFDLRLIVTCGGRNYYQDAAQIVDDALNSLLGTSFGQPMSRGDFLAALETMKRSIDLYDVVTPDWTYENVNLVQYNYRKRNDQGGTMIIAELLFMEVRETVSAVYSNGALPNISSDSPSAANPVNLGSVQPSLPTSLQSSVILGGSLA